MSDDSTFEFEASEQSFIRHGFGVTPDALETFDEWLPVNVQVFLNDEEIPVTQYTEIDWEEERPYRWLFYVSFEVGYFIPEAIYHLAGQASVTFLNDSGSPV